MNTNTATFAEKLQEQLHIAIELDKADMGNIQIFDAAKGYLYIAAQKGFKEDFLEHFRFVKAFDSSACGRAIGLGCAIVIPDVMVDLGFIPHRALARSAGFRAVRSTPVINEDGRWLGVISTHFRNPQWNLEPDTLQPMMPVLRQIMDTKVYS